MYNTPYPSGDTEHLGPYDVIFVPGSGFDAKGYRMGYGGGYYDSFLAAHPAAYKVGVGFSFQRVGTLPVEDHDAEMDQVVSD